MHSFNMTHYGHTYDEQSRPNFAEMENPGEWGKNVKTPVDIFLSENLDKWAFASRTCLQTFLLIYAALFRFFLWQRISKFEFQNPKFRC